MAKRRNLPALAKIATIRGVQQAEAQQAVARAAAEERDARVAAADAEVGRDTAETEWRDHLAGSAFAPELAQALAGRLIDRSTVARIAADRAQEASVQREDRQADWRASDARLRLAEEALRDCRRLQLRHRDELLLERVADRVTFAWSRG